MRSPWPASASSRSADAVVSRARPLLELDRSGRPRCKDASAVVGAIHGLLRTRNEDAIQELLVEGFLSGSVLRFAEHVSPQMNRVDCARFTMGSEPSLGSHFCGESPSRAVELSPFAIQRTQVTNELYGLLDERRLDVPAGDRHKPAVDVTWFDALLFAVWVGCRVPSEAEWEFACGGGVDTQWCCEHEEDLRKYAWLSDNAEGELQLSPGARRVQPVKRLEPQYPGGELAHRRRWTDRGQRPRAVRHARQRLGVVPGRLRPGLLRAVA
jgi:formylglycine-generating enzyme required for sulfatase activity